MVNENSVHVLVIRKNMHLRIWTMRPYTSIAFIALAGLVFVAVSCAGGTPDSTGSQTPQPDGFASVTGRIQDVKSSSFLAIGSVTLVDDEGVVWEFEGNDVAIPEFSPSHLRDHMLRGLPIVVVYRVEGGSLILVDVLDAPAR